MTESSNEKRYYVIGRLDFKKGKFITLLASTGLYE